MIKKIAVKYLIWIVLSLFIVLTTIFTVQHYSLQKASFKQHVLARTSQILLKSDLRIDALKLLRSGSIKEISIWNENNELEISTSDSFKELIFSDSWRTGEWKYIEKVNEVELWVSGSPRGRIYAFLIDPNLTGISFFSCLWDAFWLSFWISLLNGATFIFFVFNQRAPLKTRYKKLQDHFENQHSNLKDLFVYSDSLNQSYSDQVEQLRTLHEDMNELALITKDNSDKTFEANHISDSISTSTSMGTITVHTLSESMQNISASMNKTTAIIKAIDEIAFQTNILSVNASVEAARAGHAGAGFAVVADEVRRLAMRTTVAARETAEILTQTQTFVTDGIKVTEEVSAVFHEIDSQTVTVYKILSKLSGTVEEEQKRMSEIAYKISLATQFSNHSNQSLNEINGILKLDLNKFNSYNELLTELNNEISLSRQEIDLLKSKVESTQNKVKTWADERLAGIKKLTSKKSS